jgi:hypothetical protein
VHDRVCIVRIERATWLRQKLKLSSRYDVRPVDGYELVSIGARLFMPKPENVAELVHNAARNARDDAHVAAAVIPNLIDETGVWIRAVMNRQNWRRAVVPSCAFEHPVAANPRESVNKPKHLYVERMRIDPLVDG